MRAITSWDVAESTLYLSVAAAIGSLPFFFVRRVSQRQVAMGNCIAAGFMIAAACGMLFESFEAEAEHELRALVASTSSDPSLGVSSMTLAACRFLSRLAPALIIDSVRFSAWLVLDTLLGVMVGVMVLVLLESLCHVELEDDDQPSAASKDSKPAESKNTASNSRRVVSFLVSITVHAMAEGLGVGISYAGSTGDVMGPLYLIAMALHNIPEGAVVTMVLISNGFTPFKALLANIGHVLPQLCLSVPAFMFVDRMAWLQHFSCGLAAGSLLYTALADLLPEAYESMPDSRRMCAVLVMASMAVMMAVEVLAH